MQNRNLLYLYQMIIGQKSERFSRFCGILVLIFAPQTLLNLSFTRIQFRFLVSRRRSHLYLFSVSEAAPVLCRGGARYTATIRDCHRAALHRSFLASAEFWLKRERTGGGVGRGTRFIAGNARHPGTRPGQPAIKGTLNRYSDFVRQAPIGKFQVYKSVRNFL